VANRGHGYDNYEGDYEGSAHPYTSPGEVADAAAVDSKLMGYWLGKDFYCRS
jgi:hypothetical protein